MPGKIKLDIKDKKILYQLEANCRQPLSILAKNVGLSREVVNYRIKQLEKKGVIEYYVTTIDLVRLGLCYCRVFYRYSHVSQEMEQQIIKTAQDDSSVTWIALGEGDMNLAVVYVLSNINTVQRKHFDFLYKFGNYFKSHSISLGLQIYHFKHSYLYSEPDRKAVVVGESKEIIETDSLDMKILHELMKDPRISLLDLAKKTDISVKTLNKRIRELIEKRVILGFRIKINTRLLDYEHYKVFLYLENLTQDSMNRLISFLSQRKEVIFITVPFGNAHLEFEFIAEGKVKLFEFMKTLSNSFPDMIRDYESALIYKEPITSYLPRITN